MKNSWRQRVYSKYISSGQAGDVESDVEEQFAPRQPYIQRLIRKHIPRDRNLRILDLGCGHGAFLYFLQMAGYRDLHGVDVSAEQVALAHRLGITSVEQGDMAAYLSGIESGGVDVVLLMDVLEHLPRQELFDLLDEVFRVMRPGGKCIAHMPNAAGLYGMRIRYGDLTHELAFTPTSAQQAFAAVGFDEIRCFEEQPSVHGVVSALRWLLWKVMTLPSRLLLAAETGGTAFILSQNMLVTALKPDPQPATQ